MGYRIKVTPEAVQDLRDIFLYVADDDPVAAHRLRKHLVAAVKMTQDFQRAGRVVPEIKNPLIRELIRSPYRIIYRIQESQQMIEVLRFWHAARGNPKF